MKHLLLFLFLPVIGFSQTVGPNSPATGSSIGTVGVTPWISPGSITSSNDGYATVSAAATTTEYVQATNFGFSLVNTDVIAGISLDVERSQVPNPVTLLSGWTIGNTGATIVAGLNRVLVVSVGFENLLPLDITAITYGGVSMTFLDESTVFNGFLGQTETWYIKESQLAAISGTAINVTYSGVKDQYFDIIGSAVYGNVDQDLTFVSTVDNVVTTTGATTLNPALNVTEGSMSVYTLFAGTPASSTMGASNIMTINSAFVKQFEFNSFNTGFNTSGGLFFLAQKSQPSNGNETPASNYTGGHNRRLVVAFNLRRARNLDNSVRIRKAGGYVGGEKALTTLDWPITDTYVTYGGSSDLWGTSWTFSDINSTNFGAGVSAFMRNNGSVRVDHMRITVYKTTVLPVELVSFSSSSRGKTVALNWITASEKDVDRFSVERSTDGFNFDPIGSVRSAGDTDKARNYELIDERPVVGTNYYRLKSIDTDGSFEYSDIVAELFEITPEFTVYPNPASGWAKVLSETSIDEVVIVDAKGQILQQLSGNGKDNSEDIDLSAYEDGVYYICIKTKGETVIKELVKVSRLSGEIH